MHLKRWITGLSALPFLIYIIIKGGMDLYAVYRAGGPDWAVGVFPRHLEP